MTALEIALGRDVVRTCFAVEIDWDETAARFHTGTGTLKINGKDFLGVGQLGGIGSIKQDVNNSPSQVDISLSGFDDALRGELMQARYHGRPVTIYLLALNDNYQPEAVEVVFKGQLVDSKIKFGKKNSITVKASNRLEDWSKKRSDRFNDESQNARHKDDRVFKHVSDVSKRKISFAGRELEINLRG